jgi:endonuclease/exonuclease/phosphatase family metal-dependent hydrolase
VVSVHFDFSRESVRRRQAETLAARLAERGRPLIVSGDFNCSWEDEGDALRVLAERLDLRAHEPASGARVTHPFTGKRLDWILVSRRFEFTAYEVLADALSDHRAVAAVIGIAAE